MSECHKNVDDYYGCHITVWIPRCAGREAFDGVEPLPEYEKKIGKIQMVYDIESMKGIKNIS